MNTIKNKVKYWNPCNECKGDGKKRKRTRRKRKANTEVTSNQPPKYHLIQCSKCAGSGLIQSHKPPVVDTNYPHVAIIGAGIGGVALAVACLHRGIPFTLYERDTSFNSRSQGYGLTLQQASKSLKSFGILSLKEKVISTKHIVHTTKGEIIGEWGMRKWVNSNIKTTSKNTNIHIPRQSLRLELLEQLGDKNTVQWGHQFISYKKDKNGTVELKFKVDGEIKSTKADLVVGADGIRSSIRKSLIGETTTPLNYLGCIVILGICSLKKIKDIKGSTLLDSSTVFQTVNGKERIYMMPFTSDSIMWQFSFPITENEAKKLSSKGSEALKEEAIKRCNWHNPIPQILAATPKAEISGYPIYDRELLNPKLLQKEKQITLIGDAAHPMSPFKGQGANQALLDALSLAQEITKGCKPLSQWKKNGIQKNVLTNFESEMLKRSSSKVKDSAKAVKFLHSKIVLRKTNAPRGK